MEEMQRERAGESLSTRLAEVRRCSWNKEFEREDPEKMGEGGPVLHAMCSTNGKGKKEGGLDGDQQG